MRLKMSVGLKVNFALCINNIWIPFSVFSTLFCLFSTACVCICTIIRIMFVSLYHKVQSLSKLFVSLQRLDGADCNIGWVFAHTTRSYIPNSNKFFCKRKLHVGSASKQDVLQNRTLHPTWPEQTVLSESRGLERDASRGQGEIIREENTKPSKSSRCLSALKWHPAALAVSMKTVHTHCRLGKTDPVYMRSCLHNR